MSTEQQIVVASTDLELRPEKFRRLVDGRWTDLFTLRNGKGMVVKITNLGAKVEQILVPDRNGVLGDVALGFDSIEGVIDGQPSMGAFIGRYANRIRDAAFELDGERYELTANAGKNCVHGGVRGSRFRVFSARQISGNVLELMHVFLDGEEGFPGTLPVRVTYTVSEDNELRMDWTAVAHDKSTVANFTNHAFFNLRGDAAVSALDTVVKINADRVLEVDETCLPTGRLNDVTGSMLDLRQGRLIGEGVNADEEQIRRTNGYDHHFVLNERGSPEKPVFAASAYDPVSGREMEVWTSEPGIQFFSANGLSGKLPLDAGKGGVPFVFRGGFCLEPSRFPDSLNQPDFPSTVLRPGEWYVGSIAYRFKVRAS